MSADNGVALDGWGTSPSPDDGDRLLSPNKESAFCKRSKREKKPVSSTTATATKLWKKRTAATSTKLPKNLPSKRKIQSMQSVLKSLC